MKYQILFQHLLQCLHKHHLFLCTLESCMYPCNIIFFVSILVSRNHIKTHTFLFNSCPMLIDLSRLVYSWLSVLFSFLLLIANFLFYDSLVLTTNNFFDRWKLFFQNKNFFFQNLSWHYFLALCSYECMILAKLFGQI